MAALPEVGTPHITWTSLGLERAGDSRNDRKTHKAAVCRKPEKPGNVLTGEGKTSCLIDTFLKTSRC